jgi:tRNA(Arg) A34 adenosine deaminase TadA
MRIAIREAMKSVSKGNNPFGAIITKNNKIIARGHSRVKRTYKISEHAEINAIQKACKKMKTLDLCGCTIYSTSEPCLMCFAAILWTKISRLVYGTYVEDTRKLGFTEPAEKNLTKHKDRLEAKGGVLRSECLKVFYKWLQMEDRFVY